MSLGLFRIHRRLTKTAANSQTDSEAVGAQEPLFTAQRTLVAAALFVFALAAFIATDWVFHKSVTQPSSTPYFIYQASSWLHGRWDIWPVPLPKSDPIIQGGQAGITDLVIIGGRYYSIYGPFPALLALPFVAVFGRDMSDVLFDMIASAVNLSLLFLLFEQLRLNGLTSRPWRENVAWSMLLYLGSTGFYLSLGGEVWFTAHIVAVGCVLTSLLLAFKRLFFWSAIALAAAFLTRSTLVFGFPLLFYISWEYGGTSYSLRRFVSSVRAHRPAWEEVPWSRLAGIALVVVAMLGLYAARNAATFGNPLETGYNTLFAQRYGGVPPYGLFSYHYFITDFVSCFFTFPHVISSTFGINPEIDMLNGRNGICLFLVTPLFLFLFFVRTQARSMLRTALWVTVALMTLTVLLYVTPGYPEFGTRYLFDIFPYAWVLLLLSDVRFDWRVVALGVFAIGINYIGARQFWTGHLFDIGVHQSANGVR